MQKGSYRVQLLVCVEGSTDNAQRGLINLGQVGNYIYIGCLIFVQRKPAGVWSLYSPYHGEFLSSSR